MDLIHIVFNIFLWIVLVFFLFLFFVLPLWMMVECATSSHHGKKFKACWIIAMLFFEIATPIYGVFISKKRLFQLLSITSVIFMISFMHLKSVTKIDFNNNSLDQLTSTIKTFNEIKMPELKTEQRKEIKEDLENLREELKWEKISTKRKIIYFRVYKIFEFLIKDKKFSRFEFLVWARCYIYRHFFTVNSMFLDLFIIGLYAQELI